MQLSPQTHTHTHTHTNINNCHLQSQPDKNHITGHLESKQSDISKTNSCIKPSLTHYKWTVSNAGDLFMPNQHKSGFSTMIRSSRPSTTFTEVTLCLSADIQMYLHLTLLGFSQALRKTEHTKTHCNVSLNQKPKTAHWCILCSSNKQVNNHFRRRFCPKTLQCSYFGKPVWSLEVSESLAF